MKRIIACSVLTLGLCLGGAAYASPEAPAEQPAEAAVEQAAEPAAEPAAPVSDLEAVDQNINQIKSELSVYQETQAQIENIESQTTELSGQLETLKTSEAAVSEELGTLSSTYEAGAAPAMEKVNEMYGGEEGGYEKALLESGNVNDFFSQVDEVKKVVGEDTESLKQLREVKKGMNEKAAQLEEVQSQITPIETQITELKSQVPDYENVKGQIEYLTAQLSTLEVQREELAQIEYVSTTRTNLVNTAYQYLGTPYVWGGTTPNGFDCSGFVQYVYRQLGISIPRVTTGQEYAGIDVTGQELAAGDLVLWGRRGGTHHVGMYIGDGKYIHSPQTGDVVRIANLNSYSVARRIVY